MPKFLFHNLKLLWVWGFWSWDIWHSIRIELKHLITWRRVSWTRSETFLPASQFRGPKPCTCVSKRKKTKFDRRGITSIFPPSTFSSWSSKSFRFPSISTPIGCSDHRKDNNRSLIFSDCSGLTWTKLSYEQNHGQ